MNNLTKYEQQLAEQLKNIPLPDKDPLWDEMKKLLDDDDKRHGGGIIPPENPTNKRWLFWGIAALFLLGIFLVSPLSKKNKPSENKTVTQKPTGKDTLTTVSYAHKNLNNLIIKSNKPENQNGLQSSQSPTLNSKQENFHQDNDIILNTTPNSLSKPRAINSQKKIIETGNTNISVEKEYTTQKQRTIFHKSKYILKTRQFNADTADEDISQNNEPVKTHNATSNRNRYATIKNNKIRLKGRKIINTEVPDTGNENETGRQENETISINTQDTYYYRKVANNTKDDALAKIPAGLAKALSLNVDSTNAHTKNNKTATTNPKNIKQGKLAIGIGEQQAITTTCQCIYPGQPYTNPVGITDYLPLVYARYSVTKKIFLQTGFKYAAPQYTPYIPYNASVQLFTSYYIATSSVLRKTYYHQIPLTANFTFLPHWSVGAGLMYNVFSSATTQLKVSKQFYGELNSDSLISLAINKGKNNNSIAIFNYWAALFQTQYEWNNFSAGIRYGMGLQPYIQYIMPFTNNTITEKSKQSFGVFIYYQLWRKKK